MVFTLVKLNDGFMIGKPNKSDNTSVTADHVKTT